MVVMPHLILRTFQPLHRVAQLQHEGLLVADWNHLVPGTERPYARMVEVMAEHGIDTSGRPPVWAWRGPLRLFDADLLVDAVHELSRGFATLTFHAPDHLVLLSDYKDWCEALMTPASTPIDRWRPQAHRPGSFHPEQACLPYLHLDWVSDIKPLPTAGWNTLDLETLL